MSNFIPVNEPLLAGNEKRYLQECIETGWISSEGPFVERLESGVAAALGRKYGIAVCNGTAALDVAVRALGIGPGDEVILPSFTIISCAAAIIRAGATPVVVDSDPATWNMDVSQVEARITPRTAAVMPVHIYGLPVDMAPLEKLCEEKGLAIIEDAAEAIGLRYGNRMCGNFGQISTLSFYPNKHITTGEGGMILTDDAVVAQQCRSLRNLCFGQTNRFEHTELGWNYRMSNLQAAVGVAQLERLDEHVTRKRQIGSYYNAALADLINVQLPQESIANSDNCYWVYGLVLEQGHPLDRDTAVRTLAENGIGTRPFFWPMHEQPALKKMGLFADERHPIAEYISRRGFYIPSGLSLSDQQLERVSEAVHSVLE